MLANSSLFKLSQVHNLRPEDIRIDGDTQSRAELNLNVVEDYAELMRTDVKFPPVVAFFDGNCFWLVDGFHRLAAVQKAGLPTIEVKIGSFGTRRDAILHSVGVNADHGLRRTNADKHHAVVKLLQDKEWGAWSDSAIAKACGVSHPFVGKVRAEIFPTCNGYKSEQRKGADGRTLKIANIGKSSVKSEVDNQARDLGLSTSQLQVLPSMENYGNPTDVEDRPFAAPGIVSQPSQSRDRIENDFYPTDARLTLKLLEQVSIVGQVIDPCAGDGAIAKVIPGCITNDPCPQGGYECNYDRDATKRETWETFSDQAFDWVVTNLPFKLAHIILPLAFEHTTIGVATILRLSYLEACAGRADWLEENSDHLCKIITLNPRPHFRSDTENSDTVTVAWMVWRKDFSWKRLGIDCPFKFVSKWNIK